MIILGASGMLGVSWQRALREDRSGPRVRALDLAECDITDEASVRATLTPAPPGSPPPLIINCAAYTAVDQAETDEAKATLVNGRAVEIVANRCREIGATLVHYSTDYVFDGVAPGPRSQSSRLTESNNSAGYSSDHPRRPINAYGRSKAAGEEALERLAREGWTDWLCLRTSWLYAAHGKNFTLTIANASRAKPVLRVVNDQRGRPTSCDNLVRITRRMLDNRARGMHHGCDSGDCTWFDFATAIVERVNEQRRSRGSGGAAGEPESALCRVDPCSSDEYPRPAKRPAYSVLDLQRTEAIIGPIRHWRVTLAHVMSEILAAKN